MKVSLELPTYQSRIWYYLKDLQHIRTREREGVWAVEGSPTIVFVIANNLISPIFYNTRTNDSYPVNWDCKIGTSSRCYDSNTVTSNPRLTKIPGATAHISMDVES